MIYIATHKKFNYIEMKDYVPLQVGAQNKASLGYLEDSCGDSISDRNANYCELTGAYWIWKNTHDSIKGLVHYRRFFSYGFCYRPISIEKVDAILSKYDVILPFKSKFKTGNLANYKNCGFEKDLEVTRQVLQEKYPDYVSDFDELLNDSELCLWNMLISSSNLFDNYSSWLFDILFEVEKRVDITNYSDYQKRIFGFLSERLLNVYFRHNKNIKIFYCGVISTDTKWPLKKRFLTGLKRFVLTNYQLHVECIK